MRYKVVKKFATEPPVLAFDNYDSIQVCQDDFNRVQVGDVVELLITVVQPVAS